MAIELLANYYAFVPYDTLPGYYCTQANINGYNPYVARPSPSTQYYWVNECANVTMPQRWLSNITNRFGNVGTHCPILVSSVCSDDNYGIVLGVHDAYTERAVCFYPFPLSIYEDTDTHCCYWGSENARELSSEECCCAYCRYNIRNLCSDCLIASMPKDKTNNAMPEYVVLRMCECYTNLDCCYCRMYYIDDKDGCTSSGFYVYGDCCSYSCQCGYYGCPWEYRIKCVLKNTFGYDVSCINPVSIYIPETGGGLQNYCGCTEYCFAYSCKYEYVNNKYCYTTDIIAFMLLCTWNGQQQQRVRCSKRWCCTQENNWPTIPSCLYCYPSMHVDTNENLYVDPSAFDCVEVWNANETAPAFPNPITGCPYWSCCQVSFKYLTGPYQYQSYFDRCKLMIAYIDRTNIDNCIYNQCLVCNDSYMTICSDSTPSPEPNMQTSIGYQGEAVWGINACLNCFGNPICTCCSMCFPMTESPICFGGTPVTNVCSRAIRALHKGRFCSSYDEDPFHLQKLECPMCNCFNVCYYYRNAYGDFGVHNGIYDFWNICGLRCWVDFRSKRCWCGGCWVPYDPRCGFGACTWCDYSTGCQLTNTPFISRYSNYGTSCFDQEIAGMNCCSGGTCCLYCGDAYYEQCSSNNDCTYYSNYGIYSNNGCFNKPLGNCLYSCNGLGWITCSKCYKPLEYDVCQSTSDVDLWHRRQEICYLDLANRCFCGQLKLSFALRGAMSITDYSDMNCWTICSDNYSYDYSCCNLILIIPIGYNCKYMKKLLYCDCYDLINDCYTNIGSDGEPLVNYCWYFDQCDFYNKLYNVSYSLDTYIQSLCQQYSCKINLGLVFNCLKSLATNYCMTFDFANPTGYCYVFGGCACGVRQDQRYVNCKGNWINNCFACYEWGQMGCRPAWQIGTSFNSCYVPDEYTCCTSQYPKWYGSDWFQCNSNYPEQWNGYCRFCTNIGRTNFKCPWNQYPSCITASYVNDRNENIKGGRLCSDGYIICSTIDNIYNNGCGIADCALSQLPNIMLLGCCWQNMGSFWSNSRIEATGYTRCMLFNAGWKCYTGTYCGYGSYTAALVKALVTCCDYRYDLPNDNSKFYTMYMDYNSRSGSWKTDYCYRNISGNLRYVCCFVPLTPIMITTYCGAMNFYNSDTVYGKYTMLC